MSALQWHRLGRVACDAQIYLDLLHAGLRGPEQAKALREWDGFRRVKA